MKLILALVLSFFSISLLAVEIGQQAPAVELKMLLPGGEEVVQSINKSQLQGQKIILDFFSTNCIYCEKNMPNVKSMGDEFSDKVTVFYVGIDRNENDLRAFAKKNPDIIVALDNKRLAKKAYGVFATPTTIIIDSDNSVVFSHEGVWGDEEIVAIRKILSE